MTQPIDRIAVAELVAMGFTTREIAEKMGYSISAVKRARNALGIVASRYVYEYDRAEAERLYATGKSLNQVAELVGVSERVLRHYLSGKGLTRRNAWITDEQKAKAHELLLEGYSYAAVAEIVGGSYQTWGHIYPGYGLDARTSGAMGGATKKFNQAMRKKGLSY